MYRVVGSRSSRAPTSGRLYRSLNLDVHQRNELLAAVHVPVAKITLHDGSWDTAFERAGVVALEELDVLLLASE
jgi:hypothetical protein